MDEILSTLRAENIRSYVASQFVDKQTILDIQHRVTGEILAAPSWLAMMRRYEREEQMGIAYIYDSMSAPLKGFVARGMMPPIWTVIREVLEDRARIRLLRIYTAACLFKLEKGVLPRSWEHLVPGYLPSIPEDPFSERSLRLRVTSDGLIMYSVGQDCEDDGGKIPVINEAKEEAERGDPFFNYRGWANDIVLLLPAESPERLPTAGSE